LCNPVALAFVLVTADRAVLFIDREKLSSQDRTSLEASGVQVSDYGRVEDTLNQLPATSFLLDSRRTCSWLYKLMAGKEIVEKTNPTTHFKAVKNEVEIDHTRNTMLKDGVALTKFFKW